MFVALEFDHALFKPQIKWIVVECSGVGRKCGGPIALSPRRDRAYFVHRETAQRDAQAYADFKNGDISYTTAEEMQAARSASDGDVPADHFAYQWDHLLMAQSPLSWAVLEWSGDPDVDGPRNDVAYFVGDDEAEQDAKVFAWLRQTVIIGESR